MYQIIGGDGKEYGPVSSDQVVQWIREGRADANSRIRLVESSTWVTVGSLPEFAPPLAGSTPPPLEGGAGHIMDAEAYAASILARPARLSAGQCFSRAWALYTAKFGMFFIVTLAFIGIQFGIGLLGLIPILGILVHLASIVITGPLMGGLYYALIRGVRGGEARVDDLFAGFRMSFASLLVTHLLTTLFLLIAAIPGIGLALAGAIPLFIKKVPPDATAITFFVAGGLWFLIAAIIVSTLFIFSFALVIDRRLDFWPAMTLSRKVNARVFWSLLLVMLLAGLVNLIGILLCFVGVIFTAPLAFLILMCAYEQLFGLPAEQPVATPSP